jgi:tRNA(Arg) A34 adenosine deaminase TadA
MIGREDTGMTTEHERFMLAAIEEAERAAAEGNMAVGSVIVLGGQVVARGHNEANSSFDLTTHAETAAIRQISTSRRILNPSLRADAGPLRGALLYTTCEPCPMCAWATCIAGISTVVIGARFADMGLGYGDYAIEKLLALTGQPLEVVSRVRRAECESLRRHGHR